VARFLEAGWRGARWARAARADPGDRRRRHGTRRPARDPGVAATGGAGGPRQVRARPDQPRRVRVRATPLAHAVARGAPAAGASWHGWPLRRMRSREGPRRPARAGAGGPFGGRRERRLGGRCGRRPSGRRGQVPGQGAMEE
jgi:hypothetical protein